MTSEEPVNSTENTHTDHNGSVAQNFGLELWDQYEELVKYTDQGVEYIKKYAQFAKERIELENMFAKKMKEMMKKNMPKYTKQTGNELFTYQKAFSVAVHEVGDEANQHERIAESLTANVYKPLLQLQHDKEAEKRNIQNEGNTIRAKHDQNIQQLDRMKRRYEDSHRDAIQAKLNLEKIEYNPKVTKEAVEKSKLAVTTKDRTLSENKDQYQLFIDKFNKSQKDHYYKEMPLVFEKFFKMEQSRVARVKFLQEQLVEGLRHVFPIINTCYDNILDAGKQISSDKDLIQFMEQKKSGFPIPEDREFMEYGTTATPNLQLGISKTTKKRNLFGNAKKPAAPKLDDAEDFSHLPPNPQKKMINDKIEAIQREVGQNQASLNAIKHMLDIYEKNPALGNVRLTQEQYAEEKKNGDHMKLELYKYQVWHNQLEGTPVPQKPELLDANSRIVEPPAVTTYEDRLFVIQRHELQKQTTKAKPPRAAVPRPHPRGAGSRRSTADTDSDFSDDDDTPQDSAHYHTPAASSTVSLPASFHQGTYQQPEHYEASTESDKTASIEATHPIGRVRALYEFTSSSDGELSIIAGKEMLLLENDGSGWIYVDFNGKKGFVPLSYVETI
ncbi:Formin-binding protein 1-like isoform X3 [Oopsacas minuta]|uniref:Formin-binding protein 1-like isoform X3 n=1 Tax=Oopsacas minuta TaxID=111878 RepID=A0AAV7KIG4_9METZ|nr:Formin-binding protein 1-like isoform X3 [Oopsacas minuta]